MWNSGTMSGIATPSAKRTNPSSKCHRSRAPKASDECLSTATDRAATSDVAMVNFQPTNPPRYTQLRAATVKGMRRRPRTPKAVRAKCIRMPVSVRASFGTPHASSRRSRVVSMYIRNVIGSALLAGRFLFRLRLVIFALNLREIHRWLWKLHVHIFHLPNNDL